jgi:hypothetical protein
MLILTGISYFGAKHETHGHLCKTQAGQRKSAKALGRRRAVFIQSEFVSILY